MPGRFNGDELDRSRYASTWLALGVAAFSLSELSLLAPIAEQGIARERPERRARVSQVSLSADHGA
jgi:hypothetical protein